MINQAYKQFGNSVSVPVIKAIASQINIALNKPRLKHSFKEFTLFNHEYENIKVETR
jgi:hypothetical protein